MVRLYVTPVGPSESDEPCLRFILTFFVVLPRKSRFYNTSGVSVLNGPFVLRYRRLVSSVVTCTLTLLVHGSCPPLSRMASVFLELKLETEVVNHSKGEKRSSSYRDSKSKERPFCTYYCKDGGSSGHY